jgi:ABC-type sugar transport system permease subunit
MRVIKLMIKLTAYYLVVTAVVVTVATLYPSVQNYLPIGGAEALIGGATSEEPLASIEIGAPRVNNFVGSLFWLTIAEIGALLTILPVSWTYMACRDRKEYDQSLVETIIILPIAVTAIVVIVHNSLALAFSLAGIVGGVRFRNTLKSSGDALYILLAIGIGLSAGIGAIEIAVVMSVFFNYVFLMLWASDYGGIKGTHRYLRNNKPDEVKPDEVKPDEAKPDNP